VDKQGHLGNPRFNKLHQKDKFFSFNDKKLFFGQKSLDFKIKDK